MARVSGSEIALSPYAECNERVLEPSKRIGTDGFRECEATHSRVGIAKDAWSPVAPCPHPKSERINVNRARRTHLSTAKMPTAKGSFSSCVAPTALMIWSALLVADHRPVDRQQGALLLSIEPRVVADGVFGSCHGGLFRVNARRLCEEIFGGEMK